MEDKCYKVDKRKKLLEAKRIYSSQKWVCDLCNKTLLLGNKFNHKKSERHQLKEIKKAVKEFNEKNGNKIII